MKEFEVWDEVIEYLDTDENILKSDIDGRVLTIKTHINEHSERTYTVNEQNDTQQGLRFLKK